MVGADQQEILTQLEHSMSLHIEEGRALIVS